MMLFNSSSIKKKKGKNWIEMEFSISPKELIEEAFDLAREGGLNSPISQKWLSTIYLEKCECEWCKKLWKAIDKADKEYEKEIKKENKPS